MVWNSELCGVWGSEQLNSQPCQVLGDTFTAVGRQKAPLLWELQ